MAADRSYKSTPRTRKGALTSFGSRTDIGCLRDHNEDSLVVTPPLFAVADGMGGHAAGACCPNLPPNILTGKRSAAPSRRRTAPSSKQRAKGAAAKAWEPP